MPTKKETAKETYTISVVLIVPFQGVKMNAFFNKGRNGILINVITTSERCNETTKIMAA